MVRNLPYAAFLCISLVAAQTPGRTRERHPKLDTWSCTKRHGCKKQTSYIVIDQSQHPVHQLHEPSLNCGEWGSPPNVTVCPDEKTCAQNCIVEGIPDYETVGVSTKGGALYMKQLDGEGNVLAPRVYLLEGNEQEYEMMKLVGREFTFDVDTSKLPCGMNGALFMSEMDKRGGQSKLNPGGAYYGSGYCDAQCYTFPFVEGVGNIEGKGACCNELDIWEANSRATSYTPHVCKHPGLYRCTGDECAFEGECDEWGCGYNPYKLGNPNFYGTGLKVDTRRPYTVVTQFPAVDGKLTEIRRLYVQDGKVIQNAAVNITGGPPVQNFMDDNYCTNSPGAERFIEVGGMEQMGGALSRGMVLIFSIWWDEGGFMQWMDGLSSGSGPCNATEGDPKNIVKIQPDPTVVYSNVKWGEIDSTYSSDKGHGHPGGPKGPRGVSN